MVYFFPFIAPRGSEEMSFDGGVRDSSPLPARNAGSRTINTWWGHQGKGVTRVRGRLWAETLAHK